MPREFHQVGIYFYAPRRSSFYIYHQDTETTASHTGEVFYSREAARKRVYELNGWYLKPKRK